jgi:hypothetical protein
VSIPNFPTTLPAPSVGMAEETYLPARRDEFENGDVASSKRFSRERARFQLSWAALTNAEYATLKAFFTANQGGTFNWPHPVDGDTYVCTFSADSLQATRLDKHTVSAQLPIQED